MSPKTNYTFRLLRNFLIALFSITWILPLWVSIKSILGYVEWWHEQNMSPDELLAMNEAGNYPFWPSASPIVTSSFFLGLSLILLAITAFFLVFTIANELWPIRKKQNENK